MLENDAEFNTWRSSFEGKVARLKAGLHEGPAAAVAGARAKASPVAGQAAAQRLRARVRELEDEVGSVRQLLEATEGNLRSEVRLRMKAEEKAAQARVVAQDEQRQRDEVEARLRNEEARTGLLKSQLGDLRDADHRRAVAEDGANSRLEAATAEADELRRALDAERIGSQSLHEINEALQLRVDHLQAREAELTEAASGTELQLVELQHRASTAEDAASNRAAANDKLEQELMEWRDKWQGEANARIREETRSLDLVAQLALATGEVDSARDARAELSEVRGSLQRQLNEAVARADAEERRAQELQDTLVFVTKESEHLGKQAKRFEMQCVALEAEKSSLERLLGDASRTTAKQHADHADNEYEATKLSQQVAHLQTLLETSREAQLQQQQDAQLQESMASPSLERHARAVARLAKVQQDCALLEIERDRFREQASRGDERIQELQDQLALQRKAHYESTTAHQEALRELEMWKERLQSSLDSQMEKSQSMAMNEAKMLQLSEETKGFLKEQLEKVSEALETERADRQQLQAQLKGTTARAADAEAARKRLEARVTELSEELAAEREAHYAAKTDLAQISDKHAQTSKSLASRSREQDTLREQMMRAESEARETALDLRRAESTAEDLRRRLARQADEQTGMQSQLHEARSEVERLAKSFRAIEAQLRQATKDRDSYAAELEDAAAKARDLESFQRQSQHTSKLLQSHMEAEKTAKEQSETLIAQTMDQLECKTRECSALQERARMLQQELDLARSELAARPSPRPVVPTRSMGITASPVSGTDQGVETEHVVSRVAGVQADFEPVAASLAASPPGTAAATVQADLEPAAAAPPAAVAAAAVGPSNSELEQRLENETALNARLKQQIARLSETFRETAGESTRTLERLAAQKKKLEETVQFLQLEGSAVRTESELQLSELRSELQRRQKGEHLVRAEVEAEHRRQIELVYSEAHEEARQLRAAIAERDRVVEQERAEKNRLVKELHKVRVAFCKDLG